jgi:hypothetical protein
MAENPEYKFEENIVLDFVRGAAYPASTLVKFVGAYREGNEIKVEVKLEESEIVPEDFERMAEKICDEIYEKICKPNPEIRKAKLKFHLAGEHNEEFEEEYPQILYCPICKKETIGAHPKVCSYCGHLIQ